MLIAIFGESCTGKTTLANYIKASSNAEVFTGKDYLRMAKGEADARRLFLEKLQTAVHGSNLIYIISEPEHMALIPDGAVRVLVTAELDTIKERFSTRMHGNLPAPVTAMLEKKHGYFDREPHDFHVHNGSPGAEEICRKIF